MPKKGWKTFSIRNERLEQMIQIYEEDKRRPSNQEFGGWFDEFLNQYCEYIEALKTYGPFLEFWNAEGNIITLYDHKLKEPIPVYLDGPDKVLKCSKCKRTDCLHIGYCFAIPEVYKVLIQNGFKEPIGLKKPKRMSVMLPFL